MAFLPPGGPTEIVFSIDTTGSMSTILSEVTDRLQDMIQRLQADIPGIKFGVVAHGDYCDAEHFYVTKHMDFSDNVTDLCYFVDNVRGTGGGDVAECYELVLRLVQGLSWQPTSQRVLIMIGDAYPHEPDYPQNTLNLDWREESDALARMGVRVYGVQVGEDKTSEEFFQILSRRGGGEYLKLEDFSNICTFIMAICYRERGEDFLQGYEAEVRGARNGINKDLEGLFGTLRRDDSKASSMGGPSGLVASIPAPMSPLPKSLPKPPVKMSPKKRTSPVAAKKKASKSKSKSKPTPVKVSTKLSREMVPETRFAFKDYRWSRWHLALTARTNVSTEEGWRPVLFGKVLRRKRLNVFNSSRKCSSFVEVSFQDAPGAKRRIYMFKAINGNCTSENWYRILFGRKRQKILVKDCLQHGGRIFVRRAERRKSFSKLKQEAKTLLQQYSYRWN